MWGQSADLLPQGVRDSMIKEFRDSGILVLGEYNRQNTNNTLIHNSSIKKLLTPEKSRHKFYCTG